MKNEALPRLPFKLPSYKEIKLLGEGSYAFVYLLESTVDSSMAVIKVFKESAKDKDFQFRYRRECQSLSSLDHEGIPKILNWGVTDDHPWLMMEYAIGKTLSDYIINSFSSPILESHSNFREYEKQSIEILGNISNALSYAHSEGFIHRDLKPENILVCPDNSVKIIDFGMVKKAMKNTVQTATGTIVGTPIFIDPQILFNKGEVSEAIDMYSIGILSYAMFAGEMPYPTENVSLLIKALKKGECKTVNDVNPLASNFISSTVMAMIAPSLPDRKITSAKELIKILNKGSFPQSSTIKEQSMTLTSGVSAGRGNKRNKLQGSRHSKSSLTESRPEASAIKKRNLGIVMLLLGMVALFIYSLSDLSKDGMTNPIEELLKEQKYNRLGQIAISEKVFEWENQSNSSINLAGKLYALKLYGTIEPQKSFVIYEELIQNKIFLSLNLEETAFKLAHKIYEESPEKYGEFFNPTIAKALLLATQDIPVRSLYSSHLKSLSQLEQLLLNQQAYLKALDDRSFGKLTQDEIVSQGKAIVEKTEDFFKTSYNLTILKAYYTDLEIKSYLKHSGAYELYGYLWDIGNEKAKSSTILKNEFSMALPLIGGTMSATYAVVVDHFLKENTCSTSYGEKLKKESAKFISFWITGRDGTKGNIPYFPAAFISKDVIDSLFSCAFNQGFSDNYLSAMKGWNRYYDRKHTMKNTIQRVFSRTLIMKSINEDSWGRKALSNKEGFKGEIENFVSTIKQECCYQYLSWRAPLASDYQFFLLVGVKSMVSCGRYDDAVAFMGPLIEEMHESLIFAAAIGHHLKEVSRKAITFNTNEYKRLKMAFLDFYNNQNIPIGLRTEYLPPLLSMVLRESESFRGYGRDYTTNQGLIAAKIIRKSKLLKNTPCLSAFSDSELGLLTWAAYTTGQKNESVSEQLAFRLLMKRGDKLFKESDSLNDKEYKKALEALWFNSICCSNIGKNELRNLTRDALKNPSIFRNILNDANSHSSTNLKVEGSRSLESEMRLMFTKLLLPCLIRDVHSTDPEEEPGAQLDLAQICSKNYLKLLHELSEPRILASIINVMTYLAAQHHELAKTLHVSILSFISKEPHTLSNLRERNLIKYQTSAKLLDRACPTKLTEASQSTGAQIFKKQLIPIQKQNKIARYYLMQLLEEDDENLPVNKNTIIQLIVRTSMGLQEVEGAVNLLKSYDLNKVPLLERSRFMSLMIRGEHALFETSRLNKRADIEKRKTVLLDSLKIYSSCFGNEWDVENTVFRAISGDQFSKLKISVYQ